MEPAPENPIDRDEVMRALIAWVTEKRWDDLPRLYAEDTVVIQPFGLPEPLRLEGRDEVAAHFRRAAGLPLDMRAENVVVSPLADPELILGEFDYLITNRETGETTRAANAFVLRVRGGEIFEPATTPTTTGSGPRSGADDPGGSCRP